MTLHNSLLQAITIFTLGFSAPAGLASPGQCNWQGASVHQGKWLECSNCKWRYCQCQPGGKWGNCTNDKPHDGACDWSNPDWTNPSCQTDGSKPCDWSKPDWSNPSCKHDGDSHPPCDWTNPDWTNPNCA